MSPNVPEAEMQFSYVSARNDVGNAICATAPACTVDCATACTVEIGSGAWHFLDETPASLAQHAWMYSPRAICECASCRVRKFHALELPVLWTTACSHSTRHDIRICSHRLCFCAGGFNLARQVVVHTSAIQHLKQLPAILLCLQSLYSRRQETCLLSRSCRCILDSMAAAGVHKPCYVKISLLMQSHHECPANIRTRTSSAPVLGYVTPW